MKKVLLYLWQLPQNLVGLILLLLIKGEYKKSLCNVNFYIKKDFPGGISLGDYIIVGVENYKSIWHEYGHTIQSKYLGPLYLFIIGIPSIIWTGLYGTKLFPADKYNYYKFYTEKWADKLGGIKR